VHFVAAKGVHGDDTGQDLNQHIRNFRGIIFVEGVCEDFGDSQVGTVLDELHRCNLSPKLGVACLFPETRCTLNLDPSCPATPVGELKQADNVVEPACDLIQSNTF
jgi:hypothetical protein